MLERNKIYFGDCFDFCDQIDDGSGDLIIADLPFGITKNSWDKTLPLEQLWEQYNRIIKNNGAICLFAQGVFSAKLILSNEKMFKYDLIWKKGERSSGFLNAKKIPLKNHEQILIFYKKQPTYNPQFTKGIPLHGMGKKFKEGNLKNNNYGIFNSGKNPSANRTGDVAKYPKSVLNFEKPHPPKHPTQKPVALCEWLIKTYSNEGELVLDNVAGIGTTGKAAMNTKRDFILIEKDKKYYDMAISFLNNRNDKNV